MSFYKTNDVAKILGVNPETVRRWIREGKISCTRQMGRDGNIITDSQLREFVDKTSNHTVKLMYMEYLSQHSTRKVKVTKLSKRSVSKSA